MLIQFNIFSKDCCQLSRVQTMDPECSIFFAKCNRKTQDSIESDRELMSDALNSCENDKILQQLCTIGFLSMETMENCAEKAQKQGEFAMKKSELSRLKPKSRFISEISRFCEFDSYLHDILQYELLVGASILNKHHSRILGMFIAAAYDLQRDMIITPKRLEYAKKKEEELFLALMDSASRKQEEIKSEIHETIIFLTPKLVQEAEILEFVGVQLTDGDELVNSSDLTKCTHQIQDLLLRQLNRSLAQKLISSVRCLKESFLGTLQRCIESLESYDKEEKSKEENSHAVRAFKQVCVHGNSA